MITWNICLGHNIAINITFSRQCSDVLLFEITRLRLSRERIKKHLCFWTDFNFLLAFFVFLDLLIRKYFWNGSHAIPLRRGLVFLKNYQLFVSCKLGRIFANFLFFFTINLTKLHGICNWNNCIMIITNL